MIQVCMGMDDAHYLQAMGIQTGQDLLMVTARIDDDGFLADRVANNGAVALQRADGEGFSY
ncbi:hypothetical protein D3C75_1239700 [compost metagenome]